MVANGAQVLISIQVSISDASDRGLPPSCAWLRGIIRDKIPVLIDLGKEIANDGHVLGLASRYVV